MYTEEEKAMTNDVLGFIRRKSMIRDFEMYREMSRAYHRTDDDFSKKVRAIWMQLVTLGLVNYTNSELTLTSEGMEAYDMQGGIEAYMEAKAKSKKQDDELKTVTIWNNKVQIIVGVTSVLSFIAGVLLSDPIKKLLSYILGKV